MASKAGGPGGGSPPESIKWRQEGESHGWNKVRLELTTHSEGRLTDNDRATAERIDALPAG